MKIQNEKKTIQNWINNELSNRRSLFYKIPFKNSETGKKFIFEWAKKQAKNLTKADILFDYDYFSYNYLFVIPLNINTSTGVDMKISFWALLEWLFNYWLDHPPVKEKIKENPNGTTTGASDFHFIDIWKYLFGTFLDPNRGLGNY